MPSNQSPNPGRSVGRLHSSGSPIKALDLSWIPDGMDCNTACRFAIHILGYHEHDTHVYHATCNKNWVRDKDTISWMDFYVDLNVEIKRGSVQSFSVSFWDKVAREYSEINSDSSLLAAIDMYWDIRRLPVIISIINQPSHASSLCTDLAAVDMKSSQLLICSTEMKSDLVNNAPSDLITREPVDLITSVTNDPASHSNDPSSPTNDPWGENDEIEYFGVDDEPPDPAEPASNIGCDYIPNTDEEDNDDCAIDDEEGCDVVEHITDLENPRIAVGVTFEVVASSTEEGSR